MTVGRPSDFKPEIKEKIFTAIRKGAPYEIACKYAGISYSTFRKWVLRGEAGEDPEFVQFLKDLKEAEGITTLVWLDKIDKAMTDGVWQAAAWKLERRYPKYFSANSAVLELAEEIKEFREMKQKSQGEKNGSEER